MPKTKIKQFDWPVIGHANIISYLVQNLKSDNVSHAYLFYGPAKVGKTTVAKFFINSLVCRNLHQPDVTVPCGNCDCCRQVANNIHPDVFWVEREVNEKTGKLSKNISIEQIREMQNMLNLHSFLNSYKVAVIDGAEALSQGAANSLLKTLEEPAPKTILILLASSLSVLPKTIASRCQLIKFLPVSTTEIFEALLKKKIERKKAKSIAAAALGRPGLALDFGDRAELYLDFCDQARNFTAMIKGDLNVRFKLVSQLADANEIDGIKDILAVWRRILRDMILIKVGAENFVGSLFLLPELKLIAADYSETDLLALAREINSAGKYLDANANPKLTLENLILNF